MFTPITEDSQLKKRIKSLMWRTGMMTLAFMFDYVATNVGILDLSPEVTLFLGLVLGEASKALNNVVR